MHKNKPKFT